MRNMQTNIRNLIDDDIVYPAIMVEADFTVPVYIWTAQHDYTWNNKTFIGEGAILSFDGVEENSDLGATGITLGLAFSSNNVTADLLQKAVSEDYQGKPLKLYLQFIQNALSWVGDPILIFDGFMDVMSVEDDGDVAHISLSAESSLLRLGRTHNAKYTREEQRSRHPHDQGLDFVSSWQEKQTVWGSKTEG